MRGQAGSEFEFAPAASEKGLSITYNSAAWILAFFCLLSAGLWILARLTGSRLTGEEEHDRNLLYRAKSYSSWIATFSLIALLVGLMAFQDLSLPAYLAALFGGIGLFYLIQGFMFQTLYEKTSGNRQTARSILGDAWRLMLLCFLPMFLYWLVAGAMLPVLFYLPDVWFQGNYLWFWIAVVVSLGLAITGFLAPWGLKVFYRAKRVHVGRFFRAAQKAGKSVGKDFKAVYLFPAQPTGRVFIVTDLHGTVMASENTEIFFNDDELDAIAFHEAAHHKMKHPLRLLSGSVVCGLVLMFSLGAGLADLLEWAEENFSVTTIMDEEIYLFIVVMLAVILCLAILPLQYYFTRRLEYSADRAAVLKGAAPDHLISALTKLHQRNLMGSRWTWVDRFFESHPSLDSRVKRIKEVHSFQSPIKQ